MEGEEKDNYSPICFIGKLDKGGVEHDNSVIMVKQYVGCRLLLMEIHFYEPACLTHQYQKVTMPGATKDAHET